jgi:hypothetical protein
MAMSDWEEIAENTWRLELEDGHLYRFGSSLVHVPCSTISQSLYNLSETLGELRQLFEEATFTFNHGEARAIRTSDVGD